MSLFVALNISKYFIEFHSLWCVAWPRNHCGDTDRIRLLVEKWGLKLKIIQLLTILIKEGLSTCYNIFSHGTTECRGGNTMLTSMSWKPEDVIACHLSQTPSGL